MARFEYKRNWKKLDNAQILTNKNLPHQKEFINRLVYKLFTTK